ncbi:protein kinase [Streptomyces racemochromogenes]|uniref:Protein kinase n=1 Tax=Streptomyces racemochromogenes TaxID=67353 RepID=A0ABW7PJF1_9ACTN
MEAIGSSDPERVGPYRVLGVLGQGGMGRVLLAAAPDGRLVAVKQVHAGLAADHDFRARFRREVTASQKVSGAYTAAVMDADVDAPTPWLASVFVPGPSLGTAVAELGALPEETVRRLAAGLVTALTEIHRAGLIHRDLKPENVLLTQDGVRVIDLGIARAAESGMDTQLTRTGLVIGSPAFMSPEQAEGGELTPASDLFSLGSVLALAATGSSPFAADSTLRTLFNLVHGEPELSAVPAGLRPLVARCLAKVPAARPTPAELLRLIGPVPPAGRLPWPPAVHDLIAAQGAAIDRLLGGGADAAPGRRPTARAPQAGPERAATPTEPDARARIPDPRLEGRPPHGAAPGPAAAPGPSAGPPHGAAPGPAAETEQAAGLRHEAGRAQAPEPQHRQEPQHRAESQHRPGPERRPEPERRVGPGRGAGVAGGVTAAAAPAGPEAEPARSWARPPRAALLAAVGVLAAVGLGAWGTTWARSGPEDPGTVEVKDKYTALADCPTAAPLLPLLQRARDSSKDVHSETASGAITSCGWSQDRAAYASVDWDLELSGRGRSGTEEQRKRYAEAMTDGGGEPGIGDEAFWNGACQLVVRDGNVMVTVWLNGGQSPDACRPQVKDTARAALALTPASAR